MVRFCFICITCQPPLSFNTAEEGEQHTVSETGHIVFSAVLLGGV